MNTKQFQQLSEQGFNRIPVVKKVMADLETPVSSYLKLAQGAFSYLFESVQGGEKRGRYSMIGLPATTRLVVRGNNIEVIENDRVIESLTCDDPLAFVEEFRGRYRAPTIEGVPDYHGGLVGYFAYDTVRYVEKTLADSTPEDVLNTPDIILTVSDEVVVFDNLEGSLYFIVHANPSDTNALDKAKQRLDDLAALLLKAAPLLPIVLPVDSVNKGAISEADFKSGFTEDKFKQAVETVREYILAGDAMQVVLSQRLSVPFTAQPINFYRALRCLNPSPYMYFLDMGDFHIAGSSPEILTRLEGDTLSVRPIAGTRRRGYSEEEDLALEQELLADPKEIAEHLMLIDLGRNDAGRVSTIGSVKLTEKMIIERYSHVMHIVSNVKGTLKPELTAIDLLKATLPAGTLSGAPKVRAMEIIDSLEPVKRGVYGGAVGYLAWNGNMDTAIAIRTAVIKDNVLHVQAGAGIVADSQPELEWKETMNKARAVFTAAAMAQQKVGEE